MSSSSVYHSGNVLISHGVTDFFIKRETAIKQPFFTEEVVRRGKQRRKRRLSTVTTDFFRVDSGSSKGLRNGRIGNKTRARGGFG